MCALCTTFSFANTCSFILHSHSFLTQLAKAGAQDMQVSCCCCCVTLVVSNSVQPHRRQPTRFPCPWDSPGKNTGVGCHFLLQRMKEKSESEVAQSCPTLATPWTAAYQAPPSMGFSRQNTGVGCHCLLLEKNYILLNQTALM